MVTFAIEMFVSFGKILSASKVISSMFFRCFKSIKTKILFICKHLNVIYCGPIILANFSIWFLLTNIWLKWIIPKLGHNFAIANNKWWFR